MDCVLLGMVDCLGTFVGMFIARISKGRTIREVVLGVCLIPLGFTLAWISIFGNTAIHLILNQKQKVLGDMVLSDLRCHYSNYSNISRLIRILPGLLL